MLFRSKLPSHIRFLVLSRPSEEVNRRIGKVGFEIPPSTTHAEETTSLSSVPADRQEIVSSSSVLPNNGQWATPNLFGQGEYSGSPPLEPPYKP